MTVLKILHYPDPRLRIKAEIVNNFDRDLKLLAENMFETMYEANGIGLAATQINVSKRLIVMDISSEKNNKKVFVNPELTKKSLLLKSHDEGCLSVPGIYESVERPDEVTVTYLDLDGNKQTLNADGLLSVCIQHEIDHLDGKIFVDYLSRLKQGRITKKILKEKNKISQES
jgi:peptide deformylase